MNVGQVVYKENKEESLESVFEEFENLMAE